MAKSFARRAADFNLFLTTASLALAEKIAFTPPVGMVSTSVQAALVELAAASGSGGSGGGVTFATRAAAIAAIIPSGTDVILVHHAGIVLAYVADAAGTALITAGARKWSPAHNPSPQHWGAIGDGVTDDLLPWQALLNSLVVTSTDKVTAYLNGEMTNIEAYGRTYAMSAPLVMGNVGTGTGMIYNVDLGHCRFLAIAGTWTGFFATDIPKQMMILAWRSTEDYSDDGAGVFNVNISRVIFDCAFRCGGIYLENTNSCSIQDVRIARPGKNFAGYDTSIGNPAQNPRGLRTGNGALLVRNLNIAGIEEEVGTFPSGEDQASMQTIGMRHRTNDARIVSLIINRVAKAMHIDSCAAVQFSDIHPWSRQVYIGPNTNNLMFTNCYFDYSEVVLDGSFNHYFVACYWVVGAADDGLELRATLPDTDGKGLILSGCRFKNEMTISHTNNGGNWVEAPYYDYIMDGTVFDDAAGYLWKQRIGKNFGIDNNGFSHFRRNDNLVGEAIIRGTSMSLGSGRAVSGYVGLELHAWPGALSAVIQQGVVGTLNITNNVVGGAILIGNAATPNSIQIDANGYVTTIGGMQLNGYLSSTAGAKFGGNVDLNNGAGVNFRITSLNTPTLATHAATKAYVDSAVSDIRNKINVADASAQYGEDLIMAMRPVSYEMLDIGMNHEWGNQLGLISQEVETIAPFLVRNRGDEEITLPDGTDLVIPDMLGINYAGLTIPLLITVQQLVRDKNQLIEAMTDLLTRVRALEALAPPSALS